jgi:hypothetical protein
MDVPEAGLDGASMQVSGSESEGEKEDAEVLHHDADSFEGLLRRDVACAGQTPIQSDQIQAS